jgi:hypothetical protein
MLRLMELFGTWYMLSQGFDSVVRWVLELASLGPLIYLRDALMLVTIVFGYVELGASRREAVLPFSLLTFMLLGVLISVISGLPAAQVAFGVKVWLPLLFGFLLISSGVVERYDRPRFWLWVWGLLMFGIVLNVWVTYPWAGMVMNVGGQEIEANREWVTQSFNRVSGFSRTSFDAAIFIILLAYYLTARVRTVLQQIVIWVLSGVGIVLTTTKGAILAYLVSSVVLPLVLSMKPVSVQRTRARPLLAHSVVALFGFVGAAIPLLAGQMWKGEFEQGTVEDLLFSSFGDRVTVTWPNAFGLLSGTQYATGRGLGGLGAAQTYFELSKFSPGDNLFVYLYVTAGLAGALIYFLPLLGVWRLNLLRFGDYLAFATLLFVYVFGMTVNVVESAVALMAMGACAAQLGKRRQAYPQVRPDSYGYAPQ